MLKDLELIRLLTRGYKKHNQLAAIDYYIRHVETPVNVYNLRFDTAVANESFLDTMKRTDREFKHQDIYANFAPHDIASGQVDAWLKCGRAITDHGHGFLPLRVWNGSDTINVVTENLVIGNWILSAFICCGSLPDELCTSSRDSRRSTGRAYMRQRPRLRCV